MIKTSKALQSVFLRYTHLPLGGKEIVCPYWMDDIKKGIWGVLGGKGKPEEIVQATKKAALEQKLDLGVCSEEEILFFMKKNKIGVDCSGFAFWMLDEADREKGGNGIADDIPNSQGKFIKARASVQMLTDPLVARDIKLDQIAPGDMIRLKKGNHIAVVVETLLEKNTKSIVLAHSSLNSGVCQFLIKVVDSQKGLKEQNWSEPELVKTLDVDNQDGIKRLKIWQ